jgi:hypothetical protein
MIKDLFSHKIHSSGNDWPDKLVELAFIFSEFDGQIYDRNEIEERLKKVSPRSAYAPRDQSKFRDEISAYPAYLGLYTLKRSPKGWTVALSKTAKALLVREEPDVASFMRLQLALFQYPNGMGARYTKKSLTMQANARERTLDLISQGIHFCPLRMICAGLKADAELKNCDLFDASITYEEIFALANTAKTNQQALPSIDDIKEVLTDFRGGKIAKPTNFERRFHILRHTELFCLKKGAISFRAPVNAIDRVDLQTKIDAVMNIEEQFNEFDTATRGEDLENMLIGGHWGYYFDGLRTLRADIVNDLCKDLIGTYETKFGELPKATKGMPKRSPTKYPLKIVEAHAPKPKSITKKAEYADPEATKIKRERRNLAHKMLVDSMYEHLAKIGATPQENQHIDLCADIPDDGSFIFEMKSGGENFLDQIRKGVSQLYEYRYRYGKDLKNKPELCLVLPESPHTISWIEDYLCNDREISVCWFNRTGDLVPSENSEKKLQPLIS